MSNPAIRHDRTAFVRDRATMACYSVFGAYSFWLYAFGPSLALLQAELGFSYTLIGGYSAAWAAGSIGAGMSFAPAMARLGARAMLWSTAAVTTAGAGLFLASPTVAGTLVAAVVMGWAGTLVQTTVQSILSADHGPRRDRALVEANIGAGVCAMLAPVALGGLQASPATWRTAMALPAVALVGLAVAYRRQTLPAPERAATPSTRRGSLSLACWLLCLLTAVGIGVEFCVLYFGTQMLTATTGMSAAAAATAMTLVYAGILAGRLGGARLTRHPGRTVTLLWSSLAITLLGLCLLWLSANPTLALLGLFLTGLGIANQFPLALALTLAAAPGHTDTANARTQLLGAILLLTAPFLLGALAEYTGLIPAFTIAPALTAVSALLLYAGHRLTPTTSRDCGAQPS